MKSQHHTASLLLLLLILVVTPIPVQKAGQERASEKQAFAFVNVNIVPMDKERVVREQTVVVRGGKIVQIGPARKIKVPEDAVHIEGMGKYLLPGSVAMTKYQRLYEAALLKTLGAEKRLIIHITLIEYGVLGLLAGLIGSSAATGLIWALSKYSFNIPWEFAPSVNLMGVGVTLLLVTCTGILASWDVIRKKPYAILRAE